MNGFYREKEFNVVQRNKQDIDKKKIEQLLKERGRATDKKRIKKINKLLDRLGYVKPTYKKIKPNPALYYNTTILADYKKVWEEEQR